MMTVWLHVGQPDNVAAQDDGGHQPALRLAPTAVTQAWNKLHIFKYVRFCSCKCESYYSSQACKSAAVSRSEQDELKVDVKPENFRVFVKINGPSVCYALCPLRVPKANGNLSFPKGYNRMGRQLVLLVKHEQAAL